jgi:ferric-dicitrate binding protein FerR (iron transport regulator)
MMDSQRIKYLIEKFLDEQLNETEKSELEQWKNESEHNHRLFNRVTDGKQLFEAAKESIIVDEKIARLIKEKHPELALMSGSPVVPVRRLAWFKMAPAAAVVAAVATIAVVGYFVLSNPKHEAVVKTETHAAVSDKQPGKEGAILKLSNGEEIVLDDAANGDLVKQGNTQVTKQGGLLAYNNAGKSSEVLYNTLSTPRGRQFRLALPDGSNVWLNAASSIKFPTSFTGKDREITITGEAYLEVKKDASQPFKVLTNGTQIEVIGTHFNVNAYKDESAVKTTLIEGKVKINKLGTEINSPAQQTIFLKPGQQAQVKENKIQVIENADINAALAWKNGLIVFSSADIKEVLRQVSRWYDVDIEYKGEINVPEFFGEIPRTVNLSDVLKIIELNSKLRFSVAGSKVTVTQPS